MQFNEIVIKNTDGIITLQHEKAWISFYPSTFGEGQLRYILLQQDASDDFIKCVLENLPNIGMKLDPKAKKYFIDCEDEPQLDGLFEELNFLPHTDFCHMYYKSYCCFE